ncbi:MAG: hypothetical protein GTN86_09355 [Xanthomonadales bacterium]|nr:hypothetical protein [Xanthomonadales bacterium]NIN60090.1 hypothetical protein [Xanthomonadales bacterium]NIN75460.1 hypothetical protein [Xanthomonadales bacterium]NIO13556.1 hypothetical protein [Xanthomonadales bacterium]NIP12483.1 hypothetical protein [Xanthomonadales bacterium]
MRRSVLFLVLLALLLLTAALAPLFRDDPGQVQIHFLDWTLETSVPVVLLAIAVAWLAAQVLVWIWRLPADTARRVREQRSLAQLEKGLLALTEGDWGAAERALQKSASAHGKNTARYLAAAQAADGQQATDRREYYLEQANTGGTRKRFLVELTRARMLMANGARAEALPILEDLHQRRRRHPQVLELLARCYRELGAWDALQALVPALRRSEVLEESELEDLQVEVARSRLRDSDGGGALEAAWKQLPRAMRAEVPVVEVFAEQAGKLGRSELAEPILRAALNRHWSPALVLLYGDPGADDLKRRLKQCDKWLQQYPDDAGLHLALGRLCAGDELWGKAREHLIRSLELEASSAGYDSLGQLLERQGELELAMACFRNALRLNQGKPPVPLPGDHARLVSPET